MSKWPTKNIYGEKYLGDSAIPNPTPPAQPGEAGEMVRRLRHQANVLRAEIDGTYEGFESDDPKVEIYLDLAELLREAASLIERLAPRWISVQERLPKHELGVYPVLIFGNVKRLSNWEQYNGEWEWVDYAYVTHWFDQLPNPPQKGST